MDFLTKDVQSRVMSLERSKSTKPELVVRKSAHAMGYRYRLHRTDLAGTPDLVFPKYRTVIYVHVRFWHRHLNCRKASILISNVEFWKEKYDRNFARDSRIRIEFERSDWHVCILWECETKNQDQVAHHLREVLRER